MGDIAQILGDTAAGINMTMSSSGGGGGLSSSSSSAAVPKAIRMAGMSKEVMDLLSGRQDPVSASLPPIVPAFNRPISSMAASATSARASPSDAANGGGPTAAVKNPDDVTVKVGTKWISSSKRARPWAWAPFTSSSRTDGAILRHWVRAGVEYTDYPYAKFDIHLDPVVYTEEEYRTHLQSDTWTQGETDKLMELARTFELRWPIIHDRWYDYYSCQQAGPVTAAAAGTADRGTQPTEPSSRKIEDLQHRYYGVAATLAQIRISQEAALEAQSLSAAAAASAAAATAATAGPNSSDTGMASASNHNHSVTNRTESILLEAAAARALATSAGKHQPLMASIGTGSTNKMFDVSYERERRYQMDRMWTRSKEEEAEEMELRRELRLIEAQLRKLKKSGGHILAANASSSSSSSLGPKTTQGGSGPGGLLAGFASSNPASRLPSAASSRNPSRAVSPVPGTTASGRGGGFVPNPNLADDPTILDQSFASTAPVPMPHTPYLQSGRLAPPATGGNAGLNKALLNRMDQVLKDANIPARPLPTKRVCDMYDSVRKDILTLLTLQKLVLQKEGQLQAKRVKLSKLGGSSLAQEDKVLDEERLLGITPPPNKPPVPAPAPAASKPKSAKKKVTVVSGGIVKAKGSKKSASSTGPSTDAKGGGSAVTSKTKSTGKEGGAVGAAAAAAAAAAGTKKKTVKRKRKAETSKIPIPGSAAATGAASAKASAAPGSSTGAVPIANASIPTAGAAVAAPSKKAAATPASGATAPSKAPKVTSSAIGTGVTPAKAATSQAASATPIASGSSDGGKQSGGAKKRARKA